MRIARFILACCACAACAGQVAAAPLSGNYHADCAPYDGPAFLVSLKLPAPGREISLRANAPLQDAAGQWAQGEGNRPGGATIALCRTDGEPECEYPQSAKFRIRSVAASTMTGDVEARFAGGSVERYDFSAKAAPPPEHARRCGG